MPARRAAAGRPTARDGCASLVALQADELERLADARSICVRSTFRRRSPNPTLPATSRCGNSAYCWKTMLTGRLSGGSLRDIAAAKQDPTRRSAARSRRSSASVVVLPQPDGPSSEKNSPEWTSSETPSTARTVPNRFSRSMRRISAEAVAGDRHRRASLRSSSETGRRSSRYPQRARKRSGGYL